MRLILITFSLWCSFIVSQKQLPTFLRIFLPKWQMKGTSIHASFKSKCSRVLKNWHWHNFRPKIYRVWSKILIWTSLELCQVEGQPDRPTWLAPRDKIFEIVNNSGQEGLLLYLSISRIIKRLDGSFHLLQNISFLFLSYLNFGVQI